MLRRCGESERCDIGHVAHVDERDATSACRNVDAIVLHDVAKVRVAEVLREEPGSQDRPPVALLQVLLDRVVGDERVLVGPCDGEEDDVLHAPFPGLVDERKKGLGDLGDCRGAHQEEGVGAVRAGERRAIEEVQSGELDVVPERFSGAGFVVHRGANLEATCPRGADDLETDVARRSGDEDLRHDVQRPSNARNEGETRFDSIRSRRYHLVVAEVLTSFDVRPVGLAGEGRERRDVGRPGGTRNAMTNRSRVGGGAPFFRIRHAPNDLSQRPGTKRRVATRRVVVMKKLSFVLGLAGLSLLGVACSGADDPAPFTTGPSADPLAARIAELTGAAVLGRGDEGASEAQMYVATTGGSPVLGKLTANEALAFLGNVGGRVPTANELASPTEWRAPSGGATLRFARVVPGTDVPIFDSAVVISGHDDGSFAFLGLDPLPDLHGFDVAPSISKERARAVALGNLGLQDSAELPITLTLGVQREGAPKLAYRVEISAEEPIRVHVDANTGEVLDQGAIGLDLTVQANAAASYYVAGRAANPSNGTPAVPGDPRYAADRRLPFIVDDSGRPWVTTLGGTVQLFDGRPGKTISVVQSTSEPGSLAVVDVDTTAKVNTVTDALAVDTQFNTVNAVETLASFGLRFRLKDNLVPVRVHMGAAGNGGYNPITQDLSIGDGLRQAKENNGDEGKPRIYAFYSVGTSFDSMAHEISHGAMVSLGLPVASRPTSTAKAGDRARFVEVRGLHEGLADVFGAAAEILYNRRTGGGNVGTYAVGEGMRAPKETRPGSTTTTLPLRDLLNPFSPDALRSIANHQTAVFPGYIPLPGESKEQTFANTIANEAYFHSGLVSHTWALLAAGGTNLKSRIMIDKPLGVEMATATFGLGALSFRYGQSNLRSFADATVAANLLPGPRQQVICAWAAVGVYTSADLASYNTTCTYATTGSAPAPGFACGGKADGYYCDSEQPFAAVRCRAGSIAGGLQCENGLVCQSIGASSESQAIVENGALRCAPEKGMP